MFAKKFNNNDRQELKNDLTKAGVCGIVLGLPDNSNNHQPFFNVLIHDLNVEEAVYMLELLKQRLLSEWDVNGYT